MHSNSWSPSAAVSRVRSSGRFACSLHTGTTTETILSRAMLSLYRFPALYGLAMRIAYRHDYGAPHALIGDMIGRATNVLELCCGDPALHHHIANRRRVPACVRL